MAITKEDVMNAAWSAFTEGRGGDDQAAFEAFNARYEKSATELAEHPRFWDREHRTLLSWCYKAGEIAKLNESGGVEPGLATDLALGAVAIASGTRFCA